MQISGLLVTILLVIAGLLGTGQLQHNRMLTDAEVVAVAGNMLVYRNAVSAYADSHPGFAGAVADSALGLPTWFSKKPGLANYLVAGRCYVFLPEVLPGLVGTLAKKSESINVGINVGGVLQSPTSAVTGIPLPAQVPLAAVVIIQ